MRVCPRCRAIYSTPEERCGLDGAQLTETDQDPLVGHTLDRYRVLECLGRGAMGCVYRAEHAVLGTESALKVLYGNLTLNPRLLERFRREAMAINSMHHPNIVSVSDFGASSEGLTFLVMELVHGRTLESVLQAQDTLPPVRAAQLVRQLASGIEEAHRRGFVHRDLKPANIMLADAGGLEVVKILDFGVVGLIQGAQLAKLTAAGHIVGTPTYMAPEQARGAVVGPAADLYSLGVILYEMLEGRAPFIGSGIAEVLIKHVTEPPPPMKSHRGLEKLALRLLEKRPEARPADARAVVDAIEALGLGAHRTQQVLAATIKKPPRETSRPAPEEGWIEPTVVRPSDPERTDKELLRPEISTDEGEKPDEVPDTLDLETSKHDESELREAAFHDITQPTPMFVQEHAETVPTEGVLVAPSIAHLPPRRVDLEAPTALDFHRDRPPISAHPSESEVVSSLSVADTAPPDEDRIVERAPPLPPESLIGPQRARMSPRVQWVWIFGLLLLVAVLTAVVIVRYRN